jgi:hypothetical protein
VKLIMHLYEGYGLCLRSLMHLRNGLLSFIWKDLRKTKKTPWPKSVSDRRFWAKLVPTLAHRGRHVVSVTVPYGRILGLLDRSSYFFFRVALQFY